MTATAGEHEWTRFKRFDRCDRCGTKRTLLAKRTQGGYRYAFALLNGAKRCGDDMPCTKATTHSWSDVPGGFMADRLMCGVMVRAGRSAIVVSPMKWQSVPISRRCANCNRHHKAWRRDRFELGLRR